MNLDEIVSEVRIRCGSPDSTEVPDSTIETLVEGPALRWLCRRRPARKLSYFLTVAGQQDYDVSDMALDPTYQPGDAVEYYQVDKVWWMASTFEWFSPSLRSPLPGSDVGAAMSGFDTLHNPGLVELFYKEIQAFEGTFAGIGTEVQTEAGPRVRLIPCPGTGGDKVFFSRTMPPWSSAADIPLHLRAGLIAMAVSMVFEHLMVKRGFIRSGKNFSGGGGEREKEMTDRARDEAEAAVPSLVSPFYRG